MSASPCAHRADATGAINPSIVVRLHLPDALAVLHEGTSGILRDIDRVGGNALRMAARRKLKEVDRSLVSAILADDS